jgi:hypothetical protein
MGMTDKIKNLKIGESAIVNGLTVKLVKRNEYTAFIEGNGRHRWGNLEQIIDDAKHYIETGALPRATTSWY